MTITTTQDSVVLGGNGSTTSFSFPFVGVATADISVVYTDTSGVQTTLSPSLYSVTFNPLASGLWQVGGTVTYPLSGSPIAVGTTLTISRTLPLTQTTSISNQGDFYPQVVEQALDTLCMQIQQIAAEAALSIRAPASDGSLNILPPAAKRANQALLFDVNGQPIVGAPGASGVPVSSAMQPVVAASTLEKARELMGVVEPGVVRMQRVNGAWMVFNPDGSAIDISASTTQGAQEAFNAACTPAGTPGYDLEIIGGNETAFGAYNITCTTPIVVRPMQGKKIRIGAVSFNFSPAVTGPAFTFDSMEMFDVEFAHGAQITYSGPVHTDGPALLIQPKNGTPGDNIIAVTSGKFRAPAIAVASATVSTDHVVQLDITYGTIGSCELDFSEINGAGNSNTSPASAVGIYITDPGSGCSFIGNYVKIGQIHEVNTSGMQIGASTASNSAIVGNIFDIGSIGMAGSGNTHGIDLWGSNNIFRVGDVDFAAGTGALQYYVDINPGANNNYVQIGKVGPSGATWADGGTNNQIVVGTQITNGAWTAYTPTLSPGGGSFTTASATGRYKQIGQTVSFHLEVLITSVGTATSFSVTLPTTPYETYEAFIGRETGVTGKICQLFQNSRTATLGSPQDYSGTVFTLGNNQHYVVDGVYETQ